MLFALFINDLPEYLLPDSNLYLYENDTKLFRTICIKDDGYKMCVSCMSVSERVVDPDKSNAVHTGSRGTI